MTIKNNMVSFKLNSNEKIEGIQNILKMVQGWNENFEKGEKGQAIVAVYLKKQGYQVNPIISHNAEKSGTTFGKNHKENTAFSPDFLACKVGETIFVDSKKKPHKGCLGWVNVSDYDKYYEVMKKVRGIGFKIYFPLEKEKEMWVLEKLYSAKKNFPKPEKSPSDGRLVYKIPEKFLNSYGCYE
jgi:hypothetical protein